MAEKPKQSLPSSFDQIPTILEIKDPVFYGKSAFIIPSIIVEDVDAPIISVERHLRRSDIKKTVDLLNMISQHRNLDKRLGIDGRKFSEAFSFLNETAVDAKEYHVKQDLHLLVDLVDRYFVHELKRIDVDIDDLPNDIVQIVEVVFTMIDLCPGDTEIHYKLYTKRGIGRSVSR